jgi:hypothetical protein
MHLWVCVPFVGLARTIYIYIYGGYTVFLAEESPKLQLYTEYIYDYGQF